MTSFVSMQRAVESVRDNATEIRRTFEDGRFISERDLRDVLWKTARITNAVKRLLGEETR